jgi:hypothetical protein
MLFSLKDILSSKVTLELEIPLKNCHSPPAMASPTGSLPSFNSSDEELKTSPAYAVITEST